MGILPDSYGSDAKDGSSRRHRERRNFRKAGGVGWRTPGSEVFAARHFEMSQTLADEAAQFIRFGSCR
jgi:hypothetical protein